MKVATAGDSRAINGNAWAQDNGLPSVTVNYVTAYGVYIPKASSFNGVLTSNWGSRACSLGDIGELITL
jgi:hypothetical protein